jgi:uncharacterized C2H2 Zn-finger protein
MVLPGPQGLDIQIMRIVNIVEDNDELEELLCPMCQKVGLQSLLGHKILLPNEVKQPDYDSWLQCPKCAFLCPIS